MRSTTIVGFGEALPAYRPRIDIAFPSRCLRAVPRKVSRFSHFRSDYPPICIALTLEIPITYEKFVLQSAHLTRRRWPAPVLIPRLRASAVNAGTRIVH